MKQRLSAQMTAAAWAGRSDSDAALRRLRFITELFKVWTSM
jgi:hypothetical protein